jgi:cell wall-associated NlpC family hydrolase
MSAVAGASLVSVAESYDGTRYLFGGFLPSTGWDCSGAMNNWLGNHLGMTLPLGFKWTGRTHGPDAAAYLVWSGAVTVTTPQPGDLCCWPTHIGVYVGNGRMFSAFSHDRGTLETPVTWGPKGELLTYRRIKAVPSTTATGADYTTAPPAAGCAGQMVMLPALIPYVLARRAATRWGWLCPIL